MRKLEGKELEEGMKWLDAAAKASEKSTCIKGHRGAVLVKNGRIVGEGWNSPPDGGPCVPCPRDGIDDNSRNELCFAIHAEQRALINALKTGEDLKGSKMYHVKVKDGVMRTSDDISCTLCSRFLLEGGVSEMALYHSTGLTVYDTKEFNQLSFDYFIK